MKRLLFLVVLSILLLPGLLACETVGGTPAPSPTPTRQHAALTSPTGASGGNQELVRIATQFYTLIKARRYAQAYTYLDARATDPRGQVFTRQSFEQQAQSRDSEAGPVVDFSVSAFKPQVIATVTRSQLGPYHAHLLLKEEGATWKILSLDRI